MVFNVLLPLDLRRDSENQESQKSIFGEIFSPWSETPLQILNMLSRLSIRPLRHSIMSLPRRSLLIGTSKVATTGRLTQPVVKRTLCTATNTVTTTSQNRPLAYWLLTMSGLVAGMVTVGGVTRLTRSGLSMTDWKLQGSMPPMNAAEWEKEFNRYKEFPEWQQRKSMTIEVFKYIYFWEWGHRMMGRSLGFAFAIPAMYFGIRGMIPTTLYPRLATLFGLGGAQGLIGWWMVKSGLEVDPNQKKEIRVSPYRLATHLSMAFTTFTLLLWTGLDLLNTPQIARSVASNLSLDTLKKAATLRRFSIFNGLLVATTVVSGAYVAGNDAGRAFNTFPMMGDHWIPPEILDMKPLWRNFVENTATVQFDHRVLALTTLGSIGTMYTTARMSGDLWRALPKYTRLALNLTAGMSVTQVGLGISTLLLYVPIPLAAVHQFGSLTLLSLVTCLAHSLSFARYRPDLIAKGAAAVAKKMV